MDKKQVFPKDFYWGASTASHQVEGGTVNQWSVWELAHARQLANTAEDRLMNGTVAMPKVSDWESIKVRAQNPNNYVSGKGVDHYNRYEEDFEIAKKLNLNAFRFGIEWSRIEPEEGQWNEEAIDHYKKYIKSLKRHGLEPFLNIWHWTLPTWFDNKGGFTKRRNLKYFYEFVDKVSKEFAPELKYIITLNEPNNYTSFSYVIGDWPPEVKSPIQAAFVYMNLVTAHKKSYKILKKHNAHLKIGIAAQLANIQSKRPHNIIDGVVTKVMRYGWNWWFLRRIRNYQDFVGFNYYFTDYYKNFKRDNPHVPLNDMGWYMEPEGLYPLLMRTWAHYKKPIFVTENGVADEKDQYRQWWLEESIIAMERAISEGVDLKGYLHWSLLDNFEWKYGWWPKFGLVAVDRKNNMKRHIRPSAEWLASFIKNQK